MVLPSWIRLTLFLTLIEDSRLGFRRGGCVPQEFLLGETAFCDKSFAGPFSGFLFESILN